MASIDQMAGSRPGRGAALAAAIEKGSAPALLILFLFTVLMPIRFSVGGTVLSPIRVYLLIAILPCAIQVFSGRLGRVMLVDWLFLAYGFWLFMSLVITTSGGRIPFAGITAVELVGGYFVGRFLVRTETDYRRMIRFVVIAIACLMPFAVYESFTGKLVIPDLLRPVFDTPYRGRSAYGRWGLERVYGVFEHPILWGLFCSMPLANAVMLSRGKISKMIPGAGLAIYGTFISLSSAPLLSIMLQVMMLAWGFVMRGRWKLLLILTGAAYVVIDMLSNRTPVTLLIGTLTFNPGTGYTRIAIFDYAWAGVKTSPWIGLGFQDWDRPGWLTTSVDNFWLMIAVRCGIVGAGLLMAAFLMHLVLLSRAKIADPGLKALRVGHGIVVVGVAFTLATVYMWGAISVFVMFYLGAGAWLYTQDHNHSDAQTAPVETDSGPRYTRFARVSRGGRPLTIPPTPEPAIVKNARDSGTEPATPYSRFARKPSLPRPNRTS
ncbi:hypothetical protein V8J36_18625 [Frigidibacter sp. MR17.14]|uniref:O-antigen ligase family protein n=1 Tax=Frigidibacter sp. MR17.14 TaxID=3126509 RepID=UPI003012F620